MTETIGAAEAARVAGVTKTRIKQAIQRGQLKATKQPGYNGLPEYRIDPAELAAWEQSRYRRTTTHERWADADIAALIELAATCSNAQIARYLNRSVLSVKMKRLYLNRTGAGIPRRACQFVTPFVMPRTGILIAKTCPACGLLLGAEEYRVNRRGNHRSACRRCLSKENSERPRSGDENCVILQEITYAQANNEKQRYTDDDIAVLKDRSVSDFDAAVKLGRSFYAVQTKRHKIGASLGVSRQRLPDVVQAWRIEFPAAAAALREHFRELGKPVPEALWEWSDDQQEVA